MFTFIFIIHAILCVSLVILVLIQQGKGADMGAAFGGGSNTLFGAGGAADFITKLTTSLAIAFMVTSILLVRSYSSIAYTNAGGTVDPLQGSILEGEAAPAVEVPAELPKADGLAAADLAASAVVVEPQAATEAAPVSPEVVPAAPEKKDQ